jgi:hypothetical protein
MHDIRRMPGGNPSGCFSYSFDVSLGIRNRGAQPAARDIQRTPGEVGPCFSYQE